VNWKTNLRVYDLEHNQRLEVTCRRCGHTHYLTRELIGTTPLREQLFLDEVESRTVCKARRCGGPVRIAFMRNGEASAFVGGLA
jgi:ribosomal protein L37E